MPPKREDTAVPAAPCRPRHRAPACAAPWSLIGTETTTATRRVMDTASGSKVQVPGVLACQLLMAEPAEAARLDGRAVALPGAVMLVTRRPALASLPPQLLPLASRRRVALLAVAHCSCTQSAGMPAALATAAASCRASGDVVLQLLPPRPSGSRRRGRLRVRSTT